VSRTNSDCCPDYFTHCEGLTLPSPHELARPDGPYVPQEAEPPVTIMPPSGCEFGLLNISNPLCTYRGAQYSPGDRIRDNCNTCTCQEPRYDTSCMQVTCTEDVCMVDEDLLDEISRTSGSWKPSNYSQFWGKTVEEGVLGRLGAEWPKPPESGLVPVRLRYAPASLPESWSWPLEDVRVDDQGWCHNSWLIAAIETAAQRIRVSSNGTARVSARSEVNCHPETCNEMEAGTPARSWGYVRRRGLYDLKCEASEDKCDGAGGCEVTHKIMRGYRVGRRGQREEDIMYEVMTQGPVLALMEVSRDLFRIVRGTNHCRIEEIVTAAWPQGHRGRGGRRRRRQRRRGRQ